MSKLFISLFFVISFNCFATLPINCTNIANNTPKTVANILNYLCCKDDLNKINFITKNTSIFNDWIAKGYFIIIDKANNIVLLPYEIFKKLLTPSYCEQFNDDLIKGSSVISIDDTSKISQVANISSLVKLPINVINYFIAINEYDENVYNSRRRDGITFAIVFGSIVLLVGITCLCLAIYKSKKKDYLLPRRNIDIEKDPIPTQEKDSMEMKVKYYAL
jgi:hypothetical protein